MGTSFSISPTHGQTQMIKTTMGILFCVASAAASVDHRGLEVLVERNGEIEGQIVGEEFEHPEPTNVQIVEDDRQLRSASCTRRPSTMLRRSTQLTCTLPRLAASVCMA